MKRRSFINILLLSIFPDTGFSFNRSYIFTEGERGIFKSIIEVYLPQKLIQKIDEITAHSERLFLKLRDEDRSFYLKILRVINLSPFFFKRYKFFKALDLETRRYILTNLEGERNPFRGEFIWFKDITYILVFSNKLFINIKGEQEHCQGL